jgi:hypothetical protein
MSTDTPPYLKPGRLPDVIAALQIMAAGMRPENWIESWANELSRNKAEAPRWAAMFKEHPEFFLVYQLRGKDKAALRWRYTNKFYDPETKKEYTPADTENLDQDELDRLTTKPLEADQISTLINAAIELHKRALEERAASRVWLQIVPAILSAVGVAIGAAITALWGLYKPASWG